MAGGEAFLKEQADHLKRNAWVYLISVVITSLAGSFGDLGVVLPSLLIRLDAPGWLVSFPMVATVSVAYLPVLPMGWWIRPGMSRRRLYMATCGVMCAMLLVLVVPLFMGVSRETMLVCAGVSMLLYSLAAGFSILPCWDLLARVFEERERSKLVGMATGIGQVCGVFSGIVAGWILLPGGPFKFPMDYAVSMGVFVLGSLLYIGCIGCFHEPKVEEQEAPRPTFGAYLSGLVGLVTRDKAFARTLAAACVGAMIVAVGPLALTYATRYRGFDQDWVGWLVGLKACMGVPVVLVVAKLSKRVTAQGIAMMFAGMAALGLALLPVCRGVWLLAPLVLVGQSFAMYAFCILAVMRHAGVGQTHRHLAVFYSLAFFCGLMPLGLGWVMDQAPTLAVVLAAGIAMAAVGLFWRAGNRGGPRSEQVTGEP
jgi:MFS family permease